MKSKLGMSLVLGAGLLMVSAPMFAHHGTGSSYAARDVLITKKGTVTRFSWANPHCAIYFDVKDENGNIVHWSAEMNSPGVLTQTGWTRTSLKPGDEITITMNPSLQGTPVGNIVKLIFPSGKEWVKNLGNNN